MNEIIMMKGLPASGKSTFAREFVKGKKDWVRVNNDELGNMLFGELFAEGQSGKIDSMRKLIIETSVEKGLNVLVDNTNLHPKHEEYLTALIEQTNATGKKIYKLTIKDFTDVPLSECLKRNRNRENPVPDKVIRSMFTQYIQPNIKIPEKDTSLPTAVVFDIDGTIARMTNRSPYDTTKYYDDAPIEEMVELLHMYIAKGHHIIFLTGRHEAGRAVTVKWLLDKCKVESKSYTLLMRENGDKVSDFIYKEAKFNAEVKGKYNVSIWFEDRLRNVEMARNKLGINALQTGDGDF